jgi:hypothetical protein
MLGEITTVPGPAVIVNKIILEKHVISPLCGVSYVFPPESSAQINDVSD